MSRTVQVYKSFLRWAPKQSGSRTVLVALFEKVSDPDVPDELSRDQVENALSTPGEFHHEDLKLYQEAKDKCPGDPSP